MVLWFIRLSSITVINFFFLFFQLVCLMLVNVVMGNEENWEELFSIENKNNLELNVYSEIPVGLVRYTL
jgi:hypothetical protein